jgi:hypothetical protein
MNTIKANTTKWLLGAMSLVLLAGCAPEVGSEAWCKDMADKSKADWSANEAIDYASHCVFD